MTKTVKPVVVPTFLSSRTLVWSLVLVAAFLTFWWLYSAYGRLEAVRAELRRQTKTHVEVPLMSANVPAGWAAYALTPGEFQMYRYADKPLPHIEISTDRSEAYRFRALDQNAGVVMNHIYQQLKGEPRYAAAEPEIVMTGTETLLVKPGVQGVHFVFRTDDGLQGEGLIFYLGDIRYMVWGAAEKADGESFGDISRFIARAFDEIDLPELREDFDRPVINSEVLTAEENRKTLEEAEREIVMWRLFAKRAETERATSLLPAIEHFRNAVRLLASMRRERSLVESHEFETYSRLLELRREDVRNWFVLLDKYLAMKDFAAARRQAEFIAGHATLVGEGSDLRRAADVLAGLSKAGY